MDPNQTAPLGPHCLQNDLKSQMTKQTTVVVIGSLRVKAATSL